MYTTNPPPIDRESRIFSVCIKLCENFICYMSQVAKVSRLLGCCTVSEWKLLFIRFEAEWTWGISLSYRLFLHIPALLSISLCVLVSSIIWLKLILCYFSLSFSPALSFPLFVQFHCHFQLQLIEKILYIDSYGKRHICTHKSQNRGTENGKVFVRPITSAHESNLDNNYSNLHTVKNKFRVTTEWSSSHNNKAYNFWGCANDLIRKVLIRANSKIFGENLEAKLKQCSTSNVLRVIEQRNSA